MKSFDGYAGEYFIVPNKLSGIKQEGGCVCCDRCYYIDKVRYHYDAARAVLRGNDQKLVRLADIYANCTSWINSYDACHDDRVSIDPEFMAYYGDGEKGICSRCIPCGF